MGNQKTGKSRQRTRPRKSNKLFLNDLAKTTKPARWVDGRGQGAKARLSSDALKRLEAIPLLGQDPGLAESQSGDISYDSWSGLSASARRDVIPGHVRRVSLKAGGITIELVAERLKSDWEFVARVYDRNYVRHDFILRAGRHKLLPRSGGFYRWTSSAVPRLLKLQSFKEVINFEELAW